MGLVWTVGSWTVSIAEPHRVSKSEILSDRVGDVRAAPGRKDTVAEKDDTGLDRFYV